MSQAPDSPPPTEQPGQRDRDAAPTKHAAPVERRFVARDGARAWLGRVSHCLRIHALRPYVVLPLLNALATLAYIRQEALLRQLSLDTLGQMGTSLAISTLGSAAFYYLVLQLAPRRRWAQWLLALVLGLSYALLHLLQFGYYRVFGTMITASVVDFARQHPAYALSLASDELTAAITLSATFVVLLVSWYLAWAMRSQPPRRELKPMMWAATVGVLASSLAVHPYLTLDQHAFWSCCTSFFGTGAVNVRFVPERMALPAVQTEQPPNVVIFRLESVHRDAVGLYDAQLPTTPYWQSLAAERPDEMFIAQRHVTNSSCTDVAVMLLYTGLGPDDPLALHRAAPLIWSYARAAGFDTSAFFPFALRWGDLETRLQERAGQTNLDHLMHASSSGLPLVYDLSINDDALVEAAIAYQQQREWREPLLQIVELKMPHHLGAGARTNRLQLPGFAELSASQQRLAHYYAAIYHNDQLMGKFLDAMPREVRENTVIMVVSDHGDDLLGRMPRVDNYFVESALVPMWLQIPRNIQRRIAPERLAALRKNCQQVVTQHEDLVPTIVDLLGLADAEPLQPALAKLPGQSLLQVKPPPEFVTMLNTGPLRSWDREGFGIFIDNATWEYVMFEGREYLFDLQSDPRGLRNLRGEPEAAAMLARVYRLIGARPELLRIAARYQLALGQQPQKEPALHNPHSSR